MSNDEVQRRTLFKTIQERRSSLIGYLLRHSNWFTTLIEEITEGRSGREKPRQKYMDEIKGVKKYVEIRKGNPPTSELR